ncbi:hypothetical protein MRX96_032754 [Rhipicephalus microplus]
MYSLEVASEVVFPLRDYTAHAPRKSFARHWVVERFVDAATLASLHAALCTTQRHAPRWGQAAAALQGSSASRISELASMQSRAENAPLHPPCMRAQPTVSQRLPLARSADLSLRRCLESEGTIALPSFAIDDVPVASYACRFVTLVSACRCIRTLLIG